MKHACQAEQQIIPLALSMLNVNLKTAFFGSKI